MSPAAVPSALKSLYEDLVDAHAGAVWRLARRLTGDDDHAEDLAQETFYEAWRSLGALKEPRAARAWLLRILVHRAAHRLRTASRRVAPEALADAGQLVGKLPVSILERMSRQEGLDAALGRLDPARRVVFLLVFQEGFTCREVGEMLDIPRGTVLSRLHRARGDLRRDLGAGERGADGRGTDMPGEAAR